MLEIYWNIEIFSKIYKDILKYLKDISKNILEYNRIMLNIA
jgi:hypothetical protein